MELISTEEFETLNVDEQKKYIQEIIGTLTKDQAHELYIQLAKNGIIDELDEETK